MKKIIFLLTTLTSSMYFLTANSANVCPTQTVVSTGASSSIAADTTKTLRQLQPEFISFQLEWREFQFSLWDSTKQSVRPEIISWMSAFPGALYRYPGGSAGNYFTWSDAVGPLAQRPARKFASWLAPYKIEFGIDEYLQFVQTVKGQAWYLANPYGNLQGPTAPMDLSLNASQLSTYMTQKSNEGKPTVVRWELGNELDRNPMYLLPPALAPLQLNINGPIKQNIPSAKTVSFLEEDCIRWGIDKYCQSAYNQALVTAHKGQIDDHSLHFYYGDDYMSVSGAVKSTCNAINDVVTVDSTHPPVFWITEHGRIPHKFWATSGNETAWKAMWPETANLEAAISIADYFISVAQIPQVQAAFVHALHGTSGPWPLFHKQSNGDMQPSAVYWAMRILRDSMLTDVLTTTTKSTNLSSNENGYDTRSVALADTQRQNFSVWAINRNAQSSSVKLAIAGLGNAKMSGQQVVLQSSKGSLMDNNYTDSNTVKPTQIPVSFTFDGNGSTTVTLPPYSVSAFSLKVQP